MRSPGEAGAPSGAHRGCPEPSPTWGTRSGGWGGHPKALLWPQISLETSACDPGCGSFVKQSHSEKSQEANSEPLKGSRSEVTPLEAALTHADNAAKPENAHVSTPKPRKANVGLTVPPRVEAEVGATFWSRGARNRTRRGAAIRPQRSPSWSGREMSPTVNHRTTRLPPSAFGNHFKSNLKRLWDL